MSPSLHLRRPISFVAACAAAGLLLGGYGASAAEQGKARKSTAGVVAETVEVTGGVTGMPANTEPEAACTKVRRRLWVEGEGWVVRRVGQCR